MATLLIRNLDDSVRDKLRVRAAERGRSMEAEAREILADVVSPETEGDDNGASFVAELRSVFADLGGVELALFPDQAFSDAIDIFGDEADEE